MSRARRLSRVLGATNRYLRLVEISKTSPARLQRRWAREMLRVFGVHLTVKGVPSPDPVLFVGNHISYLDIPVLMAMAPVHFLAKQELGKWPLFGRAMRAAGTIFVDRSSKESRARVGDLLAEIVKKSSRPVAVFPSGTTTVDEAVPWRHGIFHMAHDHQIPIQPFRLSYQPLRTAAFIGDDAFLPHIWKLLGHPVEATLELLPVRPVRDPENECAELWRWAKQMVH